MSDHELAYFYAEKETHIMAEYGYMRVSSTDQN